MTATIDYFAEINKTELMRVVVALATEVYETRDRLTALETLLGEQGIDMGSLDAPVEPAVYDEQRKETRDRFVSNVFSSLNR